MTPYALTLADVAKTYPARGKMPEKTALHGLTLNVPAGAMMALLGPNGAGKSTLINIIAGLVIKSAGHVTVNGIDLDARPEELRATVGIVPQEISFDPFFTPRRMLDIQSGLYGVPRKQRRTEQLLDMMGLADKADAPARSLSGGMKRRLMVAKALVHSPKLLILDEPTAGVDIELRQQLWANVKALNRAGTTVLLTTHYLEEAEQLCDRIAIINHGRLIADSDKETLLSRISGKELRIRVDRDITAVPAGTNLETAGPRHFLARYSPERETVDPILRSVQQSGYRIVDLSTDKSDLEDVFLQLTRAA